MISGGGGRLLVPLGGLVLAATVAGAAALQPDPAALARATPDLRARLREDALVYFRFVNRPWTARVCEVFAPELAGLPVVQLHGDAHVEQYAFTTEAWGLDDFDDSARGPALVDIVRFLGSVELAVRSRGWMRELDRLFDAFFDGYRRGLADPKYRPREPGVVRRLRPRTPISRGVYLVRGEEQMLPMDDAERANLAAGLGEFARLAKDVRPDLAPGYFHLKRAGRLRMGIGSAIANKMLIRVEGPSADALDDVLLEAKELSTLAGIACLEMPAGPEVRRVITGSEQMGRLSHDILAVAPTLEEDRTREWWIRSWEPSYREVRLGDIRSERELAAIVRDSGAQLGAGCLHPLGTPAETSRRVQEEQAAVTRLEDRMRQGARNLVAELLAGWEAFRASPGD